MAQGIDFTGLIRGTQMADNANWANIRRIQDQDTYAIQREEALAKQQQQRYGREASTYLSTILPNLQRYADQGLDPVDALLNQRSAIQNDQAFQNMPPEVQTQVLNGLGQTASLHMQSLAKSGDYTNLQRLISAFGGTNPVNPLGAAVSTGDPMAIFNAVNARSPGMLTLSADKQFVINAAGQQVPLADWAAYTAAGLGTENSAAGGLGAFQQQGQQDRTLSAAEAQQKQSDTYQAMLAIKSGLPVEQVKLVFPNADPAIFMTAVPGAAAGPTIATPEQVAALSTPIVPGAAPVAAAAAVPGASAETPPSVWQQVAAQVQIANAPQLNNSLTTIVQQIEQSKARQAALAATQQQLNQQLTTYAAEANKQSPFSLASEQSPAKRMVDAIQQKLAEIDKEYGAITKNMQGFTQLARQIQTRQQMLGLPTANAAPTTDVWAQLQGDLSR